MPLAHTHPADMLALCDVVDPDSNGTGSASTGWIDAGDFHGMLGVIMVGTLGTNSTIDAKIEQAQDDSGTGAKDVAGAEITQITQAGTDQSNTQRIISMQCDRLDVGGGFHWVRLTLTTGTAASYSAATLFGIPARVGPASDLNGSTVDEVVRV